MHKRDIYKSLMAGVTCLLISIPVFGDAGEGISINGATLKRDGNKMNVGMELSFPTLKVGSTGAAVITPMIVGEAADTLRLPSVGIYGRTSWYASRRNDRMPSDDTADRLLRYNKNMAPVEYLQAVDYEDWMNGSELVVECAEYGCAGCNKGAVITELARYKNIKYEPTLMYQAVVGDGEKVRELSGRAYVDFPVNRTELYPDYRRNTIEIAKIIATIDSVRNDEDITVTKITIKGYASPEGPYDNNIRLAKGRTATLTKYVQNLYNFPNGFIQTAYEPEDWEGLREYVVSSNIENREGILAIIDSNMAPDPKNSKLQSTYPAQYKFLLQTVYPGLRHSDYTIQYSIRSFSDPEEIRRLIKTAPQKLSLSEVYLAVRDLEPGSDEYNEIFETAARLFPNEPAASLNAANALLQRGDTIGAERYLERAGNSPEATYARGVLAAMNGDYEGGIKLMEQARSEGLAIDESVLDHVKEAAMYR